MGKKGVVLGYVVVVMDRNLGIDYWVGLLVKGGCKLYKLREVPHSLRTAVYFRLVETLDAKDDEAAGPFVKMSLLDEQAKIKHLHELGAQLDRQRRIEELRENGEVKYEEPKCLKKKKRKHPVDGPVVWGVCTKCGMRKTYDIFRYHKKVMCGDCRYKYIHGRWPNKPPKPSNESFIELDVSESEDDADGTRFCSDRGMNRRQRFNVMTVRHMEFVNQWLDESVLSLK